MNLEGKNIVIREAEAQDLEALKVIAQEPSVSRYFSEEDLVGMQVIALKDKGTVLGAIALREHPDLHEQQVVYFLSDAFKGCGYTKEAVTLLSDEALKCRDIPYVIIVADEGNASAQRVAEKTGFGLYEKRVSVAGRLTGLTGDVYLYFRKY